MCYNGLDISLTLFYFDRLLLYGLDWHYYRVDINRYRIIQPEYNYITHNTNKIIIIYWYFSLFGYIEDRLANELSVDGERLNGFVCLVQSILLASFATILAAHRSEILDQKISVEEDDVVPYEAPSRTTIV